MRIRALPHRTVIDLMSNVSKALIQGYRRVNNIGTLYKPEGKLIGQHVLSPGNRGVNQMESSPVRSVHSSGEDDR